MGSVAHIALGFFSCGLPTVGFPLVTTSFVERPLVHDAWFLQGFRLAVLGKRLELETSQIPSR